MGGVLRPVGPESAETYWMRRALVVAAFLVLLIVLLVVLINLGGSPGQAAPTSNQPAIPAGTSTSASPTASATPSGTAPAAGSSAPTGAPTAPSTSASPSAEPSTSASPSNNASDNPSSKTIPSQTATPPPVITACTADELTATIKSKSHNVKIRSRVDFDVSYTNHSDQPCAFSVSPEQYQLTITSGIDRVWSTEDCARLVHSAKVTLKPGHSVAWSIVWSGKRSLQGATCKSNPEPVKAGYYHATSELEGTPAQDYLMVLS